MSAAEPSSNRAGFAARAAGMVLRPGRTLEAAAVEPAAQRDLWLGYIAPLAAIGPVCSALGLFLLEPSVAGVGIPMRASAPEAVLGAAVGYALGLVATFLLILVVDLTAPLFGGTRNRIQATKLVALSGTAVWLAGVFDLYPSLGFPLGILGGLWSLYALYLGLPVLMRSRSEGLTYFATVLAIALGLALAQRLAAGFIL